MAGNCKYRYKFNPSTDKRDKVVDVNKNITFGGNIKVEGSLIATILSIGDYWKLIEDVNKDLVLYKYYNYGWEEAHRWIYESL